MTNSLNKPRGARRVLTAEQEADVVLAYATEPGASLRSLSIRFNVGISVIRGAIRRAKAVVK